MPPTPPRSFVLVLGALTALGPLTIDAYLPALPSIEAELGARAGAGAVPLSTFFLGLSGAQLVWGVLADRWGRRPPLLWGMGLYAVASALCALAPSLAALAGVRLLQGIGAAASMVITRTLVRDVWSGREVARVLSLIVLVMGVAPILAPMMGGALLQVAGWRAIFGVLTVAGIALWGVAWAGVPETRPAVVPESLLEGVRGVFSDRAFVAYALAGGAAQAGMFAYISGSPDVFVKQIGVSPTTFAACFGANAAGLIAVSQLNRYLLTRVSPEALSWVGTLTTIAVSVVLLWEGGSPTFWTVEVLLFVFLSARGLIMSNATALALEGQGARAGVASAWMGSLQFAISAVGSAGVAALADGTARPMSGVMLGTALVSLAALWWGGRGRALGGRG